MGLAFYNHTVREELKRATTQAAGNAQPRALDGEHIEQGDPKDLAAANGKVFGQDHRLDLPGFAKAWKNKGPYKPNKLSVEDGRLIRKPKYIVLHSIAGLVAEGTDGR